MHAFVEETNLSFLDFVIHNKQKDTNFVLQKLFKAHPLNNTNDSQSHCILMK